MAYTGTGTQSDPFVVTTFADFLTCVAQDGVYVKVDADIDAAAEGYDYIDPINVAAIKVYADTMKKISNVTVEGNAVMEFTMNSTLSTDIAAVMRLHLENWAWKAIPATYVVSHNPFMFSRTKSNGGVLRYCKVSISVTPQTSSTVVKLQNKMAIMDSAVVMEQHGGLFSPQNNNNADDRKENTTILLKGIGDVSFDVSGYVNRFVQCYNAGIILKNIHVTSDKGFYSSDGFGYMVFEDCTLPASGTIWGDKASNLICFAGTTDATGITVNTGTVVTQEQLKSKAYLQSIGWLP